MSEREESEGQDAADRMKQEDFPKIDVYRKERPVILREEDDGGRVMVMMDEERVRPGS